ncbi:MAG: phospholipase D-like domain-containing protein, partial [Acutalibacteraceae bacterium]
KIMVIDGHTGFTGGINIADEYINEKNLHGHWKDTAVMIKGEGVWNLTLLFLTMWNGIRKTDESYNIFRPSVYSGELGFDVKKDGYVCPYGDTPLDNEPFGENIYLNIINKSQQYLYIMTPYLIIDNELATALVLAAKRGVDVRIMTPGKPDKKTVFQVTRSHYPKLIEGGVKIYEYTPGFVHAKNFVCDDTIATVGSVNLDYRSLYLHFENGCIFYKSSIVNDIRDDFIECQKKSRKVTLKKRRYFSFFSNTYYAILRLFSPLM